MLIDVILDRKEGGIIYTPKGMYNYCNDCSEYWEVARALDSGTELDVKRELCNYIDSEEYNPEIKNYINSVNWL